MLVPGRMNATTFFAFLHRLLHRATRPMVLIVDGHPAHRAQKVQQFLTRVKDRLRLFFLPPSAPDVNPVEFVWADLKHQTVGRTLITPSRGFTQDSPRLFRSAATESGPRAGLLSRARCWYSA